MDWRSLVQYAEVVFLGEDHYFEEKDEIKQRDMEAGIAKDLKMAWGYSPAAYLRIIQESKRAGIRILALGQDSFKDNSSKICRIKDRECDIVDCEMAGRLAEAAKGGAQIAVLIGRNHAAIQRQPRHLKELYGISSNTYLFVSRYRSIKADWNEALYDLTREASLDTIPFYFGLDRKITGFDGFVFFPTKL